MHRECPLCKQDVFSLHSKASVIEVGSVTVDDADDVDSPHNGGGDEDNDDVLLLQIDDVVDMPLSPRVGGTRTLAGVNPMFSSDEVMDDSVENGVARCVREGEMAATYEDEHECAYEDEDGSSMSNFPIL